MEFRLLESFVIAAELRSFTRAADSLGVTQAAVSQHVAALEKELKVSLFERTGRAVLLTEAGTTLYGYARQILDLARAARDEITQATNVVRGTLKLGASSVPSEWLLPELLVEFRKRYPDIRESVVVSDSSHTIEAVESGAIEIALVGEPPHSGQLNARPIATDRLVLVVPPCHPFATLDSIELEQLVSQPMIVRESASASRRCVDQALCSAGLSPTRLMISMEVNSNDAIRAAVERGLGIAFLSASAMKREISDGRLIPIEVVSVCPQRNLYVVTDPNRMPTLLAREFLAFLDQWRELAN